MGINKAVQKARIPIFVRTINVVHSTISKKKSMDEENIVDSLNDMLIDEFGDMWKMIGLDMKDTLDMKGSDNENFTSSDMDGGDF